MFTEAEFDRAFRAAGLEARFDPEGIDTVGRGLWVAGKPGLTTPAAAPRQNPREPEPS